MYFTNKNDTSIIFIFILIFQVRGEHQNNTMPKVNQEYFENKRKIILDAAIRVFFNKPAYSVKMKDIVKSVKCVDYLGNEKVFSNSEMKFEYRRSILKYEKYIVTEVEMELEKGDKEQILAKMEKYSNSRKEKQPLEYPSAGSTFKRGEDFLTAKLIEEAGLKGLCVGEAEVSTKHSGFIINKGNAKAKDVLELVEKVKKEIYKKFDKKIELEIEVIGK